MRGAYRTGELAITPEHQDCSAPDGRIQRSRRCLGRQKAQAEWEPSAGRPDPVEILIEQGKSRIEELLPVRCAPIKTDPFAFLRGAAAIMAADLAAMPGTGLRVQSCGDCHLANFGSYATPEGTPIFDINDFYETCRPRSNGM
jgi:uncharacterized protein DUF2252